MKRYPYFAVRAEIQGNEHINVFNDMPVVVKQEIRTIALLSEESNYFPFAFQYSGRKIVLDMAHTITDGSGIMPFFKTFLYYYVRYATGEEISNEGINLVDSPMFDDELGDPRSNIDFSKIVIPEVQKPDSEEHFRIRELHTKKIGTKVAHFLTINESEFMNFVKKSDGSPSVLFSVLFTKVFWMLSNTDKQVAVAISCDHRSALHNKHSYRALSNVISVVYKAEQKDWPIDRLCASTRENVKQQIAEQNVLVAEKMAFMFSEQLKKLPDIKALSNTLRGVTSASLDRFTVGISYPGKLGMEMFEPYVDNLFFQTDDFIDGGMIVEIMAYNKKFEIVLMQGFDDNCILDAFLKLLEKENITYEYLRKELVELATAMPELE